MRYNKFALFSAAAAALLATPASAHRQWMLPSTTVLSGTQGGVTVDAAISNDLFDPDHFPMGLDEVAVWAPDGSKQQIQNPATGRFKSTFDVMVDKPGTWKIGTEQSSMSGTFTLDGETWRVGGRRRPPASAAGQGGPAGGRPAPARPAGAGGPGGFNPAHMVATVEEIPANANDVKLSERVSRHFVFVTADAPTEGVFAPTGKGLEMQPITHPSGLVADEEGQFRYLIDGKPAAGVAVTVVPGAKKFREAEDAQELKTGADGILHVKWPVPGMYWMSASASDNHPSDSRASARSMTYTTTVEVVAP